MDDRYMAFAPWDPQSYPDPLSTPVDEQTPRDFLELTRSSSSSEYSPLEANPQHELIKCLEEARKQKRRVQNKEAQRKYREKKENMEVQLRKEIEEIRETMESLRTTNKALVHELCLVRKDNLHRRSERIGTTDCEAVKDELTALNAIVDRLKGAEGG